MIKLEVGKYYRDAEGDKIYVAHKFKSGVFYGVVVESEFECNIDADANYGEDGTVSDEWPAIVSEWRDLVKVDGWVNVYVNGCSFYSSKATADNMAMSTRIACVRVTGTEEV